MYEGNWDPEYEREEYAPKLKEYFKTIQVFTHNSPSFERIKELEFIFPEKEMEVITKTADKVVAMCKRFPIYND